MNAARLPWLGQWSASVRAVAREVVAIVNARSLALAFYLCLAVATSRWLPQMITLPMDEWFFGSVRFLRQTLISGLSALIAIGLVQAVATVRRQTIRRALAWGLPVLALTALLSATLRLFAVGIDIADFPSRWPWVLGIVALWTLIGGLGLLLALLMRADQRARAELSATQCERDTLAAQMLQARLSALQAQIEPHFLFNTLATVKRLYETAPSRGRQMLTHLIEYLQAALPTMRQSGSTVTRETDLARSYLTLLQMRMGERLRFDIRVEPGVKDAEMPPLVLATLIENAIKHGLSPLPEGGRIDVQAQRVGDALQVEVRDTGAGLTGSGGSGVGLANTRSRLAALYGPAAHLQLQTGAPRGVIARLTLPLPPTAATGATA
jgi:hypothetical protein